MYLNGAKVVDNDGCHGETEKHSEEMFLAAGVHSLVVDMCEVGDGEVFKMSYQGPDTGNSKITVPTSALKHSVKARTGKQHFHQHGFRKRATSERQYDYFELVGHERLGMDMRNCTERSNLQHYTLLKILALF